MRALLVLPLLVGGCGLFEGESPFQDANAWDTAGGSMGGGFWATPTPIEHQSRTLSWRSATFVEPTGMAPMSKGDDVWTGMASMVCRVSFMDGTVGTDVDPDPTDAEQVVDQDDDQVLTLTAEGWQILIPEQAAWKIEQHPNVIDARLRPGGVIWLEDLPEGCQVVDGDTPLATLPEGACHGGQSLAVDPNNGTIWIAQEDGPVQQVIPGQGVKDSPITGDVVTVDTERHIVYSGDRGGNLVTASQPDGTTLWTADLGGALKQMKAISQRGILAALVDRGTDRAVVYLDATTGALTVAMTTRARVSAVYASPDGRRIGVVSQGQVDFFEDTAPLP